MSYSLPFIIEKYSHEIVTVEQARQWLRMDIDGYDREDSIIGDLILAAVDSIETECEISLGVSTYQWNCDYRPCGIIPVNYVTEIVGADYTEYDATTDYEPTDFRLTRLGEKRSKIGWISSLTVNRNFPCSIRFKAGFEEGKVPSGLIQAIRARIGETFDNRSDGVSEKRTLSDKLIRPYRNGYAG